MPADGEYVQPVYSFGFDLPSSYAIVPAITQEYLKSQEEMIKEIEEKANQPWKISCYVARPELFVGRPKKEIIDKG